MIKYKDIGLYIHIPFCISKCPYCDFYSITDSDEKLKTEYINAIKKEMKIYSMKMKNIKLASIYIGGGTPTIIEGSQLEQLLSFIYTNFSVNYEMEITIEANPGTINLEKINFLSHSGINRISIGAQSFNNRTLKKIGRSHSREDIYTAFNLARDSGFKNINLDIMFGLPGERRKEFKETLTEVATLKPEHISLYALTIEADTPFYNLKKEKKIKLPSDSFCSLLFMDAIDFLISNGYEHYEISNFALPGKKSAHNQIYWKNKYYLGIGANSSSYIDGKRYKNMNDLINYISLLDHGILPIEYQEILPFKERMIETIILKLRMLEGMSKKEFKEMFNKSIEEYFHKEINNLKKQHLLDENETHYFLTKKGILFANNVFFEFMD